MKFTSFNDYISAERSNKFYGSTIKKKETNAVAYYMRNVEPIKEYPITIKMTWLFKTRNSDLDGMAFGRKVILDGMQKAGVLRNDNLTCIDEIIEKCEINKDMEGVYIEWYYSKECSIKENI